MVITTVIVRNNNRNNETIVMIMLTVLMIAKAPPGLMPTSTAPTAFSSTLRRAACSLTRTSEPVLLVRFKPRDLEEP